MKWKESTAISLNKTQRSVLMKNVFTRSKPVTKKKKKKTKYPSICLRCHYNCSDSSSNWLKIVQYLDVLSFVVITVYVFTFSGLKGHNYLHVRNFKPV